MRERTVVDGLVRRLPVRWTRGLLSRTWAPVRNVPDEAVLLLFVAVLCVTFFVRQPLFFSGENLQNLTRQSAVLAMMAAGQIFVILIGAIDISVGAQVSLLSVLAVVYSGMMPLPLALILAVLIGCAIGVANGLLVALFRISPIITTIATWQLLLGFNLWYTNGLPVRNFSDEYNFLGGGQVWFLPVPALLAFLAFVLAFFVLKRTQFGRYVYAIGGNAEAARLSGINVRAITVLAYVVCSFFTALGAITLSSRVGSGLPDLGSGLEIRTIAAVFIGGVAWGGGAGSVFGAMLGVALLQVLSNGFDLLGVSSNAQTMATGLLMLLAVGITRLRRKRAAV